LQLLVKLLFLIEIQTYFNEINLVRATP